MSLGTCLKYPLKLCWTLYFPAFLEKSAYFSKFCYEKIFFFIKQNVSRIQFWRNMSLWKLSQVVQSNSKCIWLTSMQIPRFWPLLRMRTTRNDRTALSLNSDIFKWSQEPKIQLRFFFLLTTLMYIPSLCSFSGKRCWVLGVCRGVGLGKCLGLVLSYL